MSGRLPVPRLVSEPHLAYSRRPTPANPVGRCRMTQHPPEPSPAALDILGLRLIATLGTTNEDGSILLTPVWYVYENGRLYVPTGGGSHKARNVRVRPSVTVLVDQRRPENHRWASAVGTAEIIA